MSLAHRRTEAVFSVLKELYENGKTDFRPGDVNTVLRERGEPLGTWEVRAEFTELERQNRIVCNEDTGMWHLAENAENASLQDAG